MTGIEQLRKLGADAVRGGEVGRAICDIADQIERETEEQSARLYDERVGEETDVCELFGVEPVDDPLTSLRRHVESLTDTVENLRLELGEARDHAADVSTSAYDLLPQEDRGAIAWVRAHGGIAYVKEEWNARSNLKRSLETAQAKVERQQRHIEFVQGKCRERQGRIAALNKTVAEMRPRLMPEGIEWPTVDGKPVDFVTGYEPSLGVLEAVSIYSNGACEVMSHDGIIKGISEIHIVSPKILDADGAEIRVKETVFDKNTGEELIVTGFEDGRVWCEHRMTDADALPVRGMWSPSLLTHERLDSWERLEEDAKRLKDDIGLYLGDYSPSCFDKPGDSIQDRVMALVRRAKALAGDA